MDHFIGEIRMIASTYAPPNWAFCDGQLLRISNYQALFSLLGTTYGGDGRITFGLPDLRGRTPIHAGQGRGLSNYIPGQLGGSETTTRPVTQGTQGSDSVLSGQPASANNMQPFLVINYMIALEGTYPQRP